MNQKVPQKVPQNAENSIKNLIFDLGGVIINIDFDLTMRALQAYTNLPLGVGAYLGKNEIFYNYETGKINSDEFLTQIKEKYQLNATNKQIIHAWNALLLDIPTEYVNLLLSLKSKYKIFILSNTNPIHIEGVEAILGQSFPIKHLSELCDKVYLSYEMGKAKPETAIYQQVINENNLNPAETMFFDDSEINLAGAQKIGIQTMLISSKRTILDILF